MPNIAFSQVSPHRRRPLFTAEVDASRANSARSTFRSVLAAGNDGVNTTLTNFEPVRVFSESDVAARAGVGSTLHLMARHFFAANPDGEVFVHPIEVSAAAQAGEVNEIDLSFDNGAVDMANADGVITIGILGERVAVYVAKNTRTGGGCIRCLRCAEGASRNFAILCDYLYGGRCGVFSPQFIHNRGFRFRYAN